MEQDFRKTKPEFLQEIINDYLNAFPEQRDWAMEDVAAWAIRQGRWHPPARNVIKWCASELAKAARVEYETDPQGRRVRTKHARREIVAVDGEAKQMVFWEDARNATPRHMRVSLQQRRGGVLADCAQLKRDTDSFNDNNGAGAHIDMSYDFTEDLFELEAPEEYPEGPPDRDGDEVDDSDEIRD
jgi:hypothetical protein